jgi:flagellar FliJ protein
MAKRSDKISKVVAIAKAKERRQGELTGQSRAELNSQINRLSELSAFRQNYTGAAKGVGKIDSAHLKDYQNFLQRLDSAVRAQQHLVQDNEQTVEAHRRRWMRERQRLESLQNVLERYQKDEYLQSERDEQRMLDDLRSKPELYDDDT